MYQTSALDSIQTTAVSSSMDKINQFYLPEWLTVELIASNIISFTPLFSYGTTILSIYKKQSSVGFSIDICATMLIASFLRIAYYFIIPYEIALLRQSLVMVCIQSLLLKVSLSYRSEQIHSHSSVGLLRELKGVYEEVVNKEFDLRSVLVFVKEVALLVFLYFVRFFDPSYKRFMKFWQWESEKAYWRFLFRFGVVLLVVTVLLQDFTRFGEFLGTVGLFVESLLPLPQILLLNRLRSVEGFKLLLLLSWLCGDLTKISYLVFGAKNISFIFLFFALFQMLLDFYIAYQFIYYKYFYEPEPETIQLHELKV